MTSNRVTLEQLTKMPIGEVSSLPVEQIAMLQEDLAAMKAKLKTMDEWLHGALNLRYGQRAADARKAEGKDAGVVKIAEDDGFLVVADSPKKVSWDQGHMATAVDVIRRWGEDPAEYVTTEIKVTEAKYNSWPSRLKALFDPGRFVSTGKPTFVIEKAGQTKAKGRRAA